MTPNDRNLIAWHKAAAVFTEGLVCLDWNEADGRPNRVIWRRCSGSLAGYTYNDGRPFIWDEVLGCSYTSVAWAPKPVFTRRTFQWCPPEALREIRQKQLAAGGVGPP